MRSLLVALLTGITPLAVLPAQQQDPTPAEAPTASPDQPFQTWTVPLPNRQGVTIWARNPTADTVAITKITLSACVNIANPCGPTEFDLRLGPADSAEVVTLRLTVAEDGYGYKVAWEWETFPSRWPALEHATRLPEQTSTSQPDRPFKTWTVLRPFRRGVTIWARNTSADTVAITRVTLSACFNIANPCGPTTLDLRLGPADSAEVMSLQPQVWDDRYSYKVAWEWSIPSDLHMSAASGGEERLPFAVWVRPSSDNRELALMTRNTSTDTVIVTHVLLTGCKNLATGCGPTPLRLLLAPGDSARALVIRPKHGGESFTFDLTWEWAWPTGNR